MGNCPGIYRTCIVIAYTVFIIYKFVMITTIYAYRDHIYI